MPSIRSRAPFHWPIYKKRREYFSKALGKTKTKEIVTKFLFSRRNAKIFEIPKTKEEEDSKIKLKKKKKTADKTDWSVGCLAYEGPEHNLFISFVFNDY